MENDREVVEAKEKKKKKKKVIKVERVKRYWVEGRKYEIDKMSIV